VRECILALDLGTTTGWAVHTVSGQIAHGYASFKVGKNDGPGVRYRKFTDWLVSFPHKPQYVYYEGVVRHVGTQAAHVYGGLQAILLTHCELSKIIYKPVAVGTIKKHATGMGNAGKAEMIAAMQSKGHSVTDDNEADALAILHWALDTHLQQ